MRPALERTRTYSGEFLVTTLSVRLGRHVPHPLALDAVRRGALHQEGKDKLNSVELARGTCKLARNELRNITLYQASLRREFSPSTAWVKGSGGKRKAGITPR